MCRGGGIRSTEGPLNKKHAQGNNCDWNVESLLMWLAKNGAEIERTLAKLFLLLNQLSLVDQRRVQQRLKALQVYLFRLDDSTATNTVP